MNDLRAVQTKADRDRAARTMTRTVGKLAENVRYALILRDQAIREARANGYPLRQIAAAAGLSHERIRTICDKEK